MLGHANIMLGTAARPIYQSKASSASTTISKPSGVAVGDLVLIVVGTGALAVQTTTGSAWGKITVTHSGGSPADGAVFWKVLTATDVTNAWTQGSAAAAIAYRYTGYGVTTLTRKVVHDVASGPANVAPGFTPSDNHRGMIAVAIVPLDSVTIALQATLGDRGGSATSASVTVGDKVAGYAGETITSTYPGAGKSTLQLFEIT